MVTCGWLSVKQLVVYHTVTMVYKILKTGSPTFLYNRLSTVHPFRTRQSSTGSIRQDETFRSKSSLPRDSFRYRGAHDYNRIPPSIRSIPNLTSFKIKLRQWVKQNIGMEPEDILLLFNVVVFSLAFPSWIFLLSLAETKVYVTLYSKKIKLTYLLR